MFGTSDSSRREFMRAAVAIGGAGALSACMERAQEPVPPGDRGALPTRQYAWVDHVPEDEHGNFRLPRHHVFLYSNYEEDGTPSADEADRLETALRSLERAYQWSNQGLLFSLGYSPSYFERFDRSLPSSVDLPAPRRLSDFEEPDLDEQDLLLQLASDSAEVVLAAEEAVLGARDEVNTVEMEADAGDFLTVDERRTGFISGGMPAEKATEGVEGIPTEANIPEQSPLFMGFKGGFADNQASEDHIAIEEGPFAEATTKHVSNIRQRLQDWYIEQDFEDRVAEMFSATHAKEEMVEGAGLNLGDGSGITDAMTTDLVETANEYGRVGHAQKNARFNRDADGNVILHRRHVESTDNGYASLHFPSLQREISQFERVRVGMNGDDVRESPRIRQRVNNGILEYIFTLHRGNFLVPARSQRSFPTPAGEVV